MEYFKYQLNDGKELWVCDSCKRTHTDLILLKTWRLIGKKDDNAKCEYCGCSPSPVPTVSVDPCVHG